MLTPIIDKHVYDCSTIVRVYSLETGSKLTIRSGNTPIGKVVAKGGSVIVRLERRLQKDEMDEMDEKLTAVAQMGSQMSNPSAPVTVLALPDPIASPLTETTLYEGGTCIGTLGVLPGSIVRAWSGANLLGRGDVQSGYVIIPLQQPLTGSDSVQLDATMCGHQSAKTAPIVPVRPRGGDLYSERLPPPQVQRPLFACQQEVGLNGLLPGAQFQVFARANGLAAPGSIVFDQCAPWVSLGVLLGKVLHEDDEVKAWQRFDTLDLKSDYSRSVYVEKPDDKLNAPKLFDPISEGERSVFVYHLLNSVKLEIAVEGVSQGMADYDGENEFDLGFELAAGQVLKARQGLCNYWSPWSDEVEVQAVRGRVPPPLLEEPLYACANIVRVAEKLEGSLVEVYVNGIYAGQGKSRLIPIAPQLQARQTVTAIQQLGKVISQESPPVVVKEVEEDQPPQPVLQFPTDPRYVEVSNLIPGARVNVLWSTLLIASKEATNTVEEILLAIEPWPGEKIHANQSICMKKSADSNVITAMGKMVIETITGSSVLTMSTPKTACNDRALVHDRLTVIVRTQWPVKEDTKVKLVPSDPNIAKVLGSGEVVIPAGGTKTTFPLQAVSSGVVYLELSAKHCKQAFNTAWIFEADNRYELVVHGAIKVSPSSKTLKEGQSFDLMISADPVPSDQKIALENWFKPPSFIVTKVITIPAGKTSTTVRYTAPQVTSEQSFDVIATRTPHRPSPGEPNDWLTPRGYEIWRYESDKCTVTVELKPAAPPTQPPTQPQPPTSTIALGKDVCANYTKGGLNPVQQATLIKIKSRTKYNLKIWRCVGSVPPGEPPFNILLGAYQEKAVSLQSKDIHNGWGAMITDNIQCDDAPDDVSFDITYKK